MLTFSNRFFPVRRRREHIVTALPIRRVVALLAAFLLAPPPAAAQAVPEPPALVLVVRHAEKVDNSDDPALSAAGSARARALGQALRAAGVEHVIVTHRQRTRLTALDVLDAQGLEAEVVPFGRDMGSHVAAVAAAAMRQSGKVVLIVGHSNTVPAIVHALGGPRLPDLCDASYATLFSVLPAVAGGTTRVVTSWFGAPDPLGAADCAGMVPR